VNTAMRFESRELKPYAEPVSAETLVPGETYFGLQFEDEDLLIPILEPLLFLGRNLRANDVDHLYFQSFESYRQGVRYDSATENQYLSFQIGTADNIKHIFEYERALDVLMMCALRRRKAARQKH
jgi:hypothetical protein